jgi:hypothetical protein
VKHTLSGTSYSAWPEVFSWTVLNLVPLQILDQGAFSKTSPPSQLWRPAHSVSYRPNAAMLTVPAEYDFVCCRKQ